MDQTVLESTRKHLLKVTKNEPLSKQDCSKTKLDLSIPSYSMLGNMDLSKAKLIDVSTSGSIFTGSVFQNSPIVAPNSQIGATTKFTNASLKTHVFIGDVVKQMSSDEQPNDILNLNIVEPIVDPIPAKGFTKFWRQVVSVLKNWKIQIYSIAIKPLAFIYRHLSVLIFGLR